MDFSTDGQNRFYECVVCKQQVRPRGVALADAPGTVGNGSSGKRLCCAHYKTWLRNNREEVQDKKGKSWRLAPVARGPLTPEEYRVARSAARRVQDRPELEQVLGILGLVGSV